ncbi:hypothetical protein QZJ86_19835 [Methylomonas montana]|uniref:hypothetical protein n=1 Tax=Methylomonas montana TaxID=3058963 RepID=UPI00265AF977|nr:hypothetical protein [Methylomonas montana]WKJ90237.1 hypothetical protein QZJ86_19835 [Methylomonas montana]
MPHLEVRCTLDGRPNEQAQLSSENGTAGIYRRNMITKAETSSGLATQVGRIKIKPLRKTGDH